jgi:hypothetical protein
LGNEEQSMKERRLDGRHRDKNQPKAGEIQQKRSDTLNKNLPNNSAVSVQYDTRQDAGKNRQGQRSGRAASRGEEGKVALGLFSPCRLWSANQPSWPALY